MAMKDGPKFKGKLILFLKKEIRYLVKFHANSQKSENLHFVGIILSKAYIDLNEKAQKSYVSWHWRVIQSLKKSVKFGSKSDMRNFVNFNASRRECKNLHFDVLILSIPYKVSAKKV